MNPIDIAAGKKLLVEIFTLPYDHSPVEELVHAIAGSVRWQDRLHVHVNHTNQWPKAETPYGEISGNTVVVCETHVLHGPDYWGLVRALESCDELAEA